MEPHFSLALAVRDYECDMQGIVNNAVYQNYLEHTRHEFLHSRELDFAALTRAGVMMVVMRAEIDYLQSLTSGDAFRVELHAERKSRRKVIFRQQIVRRQDGQVMLKALVTVGIMARDRRGELPAGLNKLLESFPRTSTKP